MGYIQSLRVAEPAPQQDRLVKTELRFLQYLSTPVSRAADQYPKQEQQLQQYLRSERSEAYARRLKELQRPA